MLHKKEYRIITAMDGRFDVQFRIRIFFISSGWNTISYGQSSLEDARKYKAEREMENNFKPEVVE